VLSRIGDRLTRFGGAAGVVQAAVPQPGGEQRRGQPHRDLGHAGGFHRRDGAGCGGDDPHGGGVGSAAAVGLVVAAGADGGGEQADLGEAEQHRAQRPVQV
jgi:hypothetical protein